jgi:hypothetical protein
MSLPVASKMRSPSRPSIVTRAKSHRLVECLAAVNMASNCRWVNPRVGAAQLVVALPASSFLTGSRRSR